jgi:hypothetical protein
MPTPDKSAERHLLVTVRSLPQHRLAVQELLLELVALVRQEPGCVYYNIFLRRSRGCSPDAPAVPLGRADVAAAGRAPAGAAHPAAERERGVASP